MTRHLVAAAAALSAALLSACSQTTSGDGPAPMPMPASSAAPHSPLTSRLFPSRWEARQVAGAALTGGRITLAFEADGAVSGSGGCNRYVGQATLQGDRLIFAPLATTRMACSAALTAQETRYLKVLGEGGTVTFTPDGALAIRGPDDSPATVFGPDTSPPAPAN